MTREELQAWVAALKPRDVVIHKRWYDDLSKLAVKKVTPSGIVRTEGGASFKLSGEFAVKFLELCDKYGVLKN